MVNMHCSVALLLIVTVVQCFPAQMDYGVAIDAGSSGSRVRVYAWPPKTDLKVIPKIEEIYSHQIRPGISSYVNNLSGLDNHITELVIKGAEQVPQNQHQDTTIYLMATSGMRVVMEEYADAVMDRINSILSNKVYNPFAYEPKNCRILSGEEEGVFAWITVNYLTEFFTKHSYDSNLMSSGIIEMGGSSAQVAFHPEGSILADKFPVKIAGTVYPLYSHSYLTYGQDTTQAWIRHYLYGESIVKDNIPNPCLFKNDVLTVEMNGTDVTFIGSGNPDECLAILDIFIYKVVPQRCQPKPCTIGSVYQPTIQDDQVFYGVSAFRYTLQSMKVLKPDGTFSIPETTRIGRERCQKNISTIRNETGRTDPFLTIECMTGLYFPLLFTKGFGFSEDTNKIIVTADINGQPLEWTLGAIIYENERRNWQCNNLKPSSGRGQHNMSASYSFSIILCLLLSLMVVKY